MCHALGSLHKTTCLSAYPLSCLLFETFDLSLKTLRSSLKSHWAAFSSSTGLFFFSFSLVFMFFFPRKTAGVGGKHPTPVPELIIRLNALCEPSIRTRGVNFQITGLALGPKSGSAGPECAAGIRMNSLMLKGHSAGLDGGL